MKKKYTKPTLIKLEGNAKLAAAKAIEAAEKSKKDKKDEKDH
jgi:hypothetical protein